jgi:hypothetical protein
MEQIFKEGDKVFDIRYGWGLVVSVNILTNDWPVEVVFDGKEELFDEYTFDGRAFNNYPTTLSFTEYSLEGFSQERPEPAPKLGDIVWGKSFNTTDWSIGHYLGKQHASYKISSTPNALSCWLADKITTENPYANE